MHSTVTKLVMPRLLVVSQSKTIKMKTLYPHQLRPKIYFQIGFGWNTDRLYNIKIKNNSTTTKNITS